MMTTTNRSISGLWLTVGAIAGTFAFQSAAAWADTMVFQQGVTPVPGYMSTDAYIRSTSPTSNTGSIDTLKVGRTTTSQDYLRSVLSFDLSSLPTQATITSVTLTLSQYTDSSSPTTVYDVQVRLLDKGFTESVVTWNKADAATNWTIAGGDYLSDTLSSLPLSANLGTSNTISRTFASSSFFVAAAQSSLASSSHQLNLELVTTAEAQASRVIYNFWSNNKPGFTPALTVTYQVPEPASLGLLTLTASCVVMGRCRSARN